MLLLYLLLEVEQYHLLQQGMRPNTRVFPFFDEHRYYSLCNTNGGSFGGNFVTDANGAVSGTFAIPDPNVDSNPRWRTGTRVFRLTSSSTNADLNNSRLQHQQRQIMTQKVY